MTSRSRHYRFTGDGITNEVVETRRVSSYLMPIPASKKKGKQLVFDTEWTKDRIEENKFINRIRGRVALWRQKRAYVGVTKTTRTLLEYCSAPIAKSGSSSAKSKRSSSSRALASQA